MNDAEEGFRDAGAETHARFSELRMRRDLTPDEAAEFLVLSEFQRFPRDPAARLEAIRLAYRKEVSRSELSGGELQRLAELRSVRKQEYLSLLGRLSLCADQEHLFEALDLAWLEALLADLPSGPHY